MIRSLNKVSVALPRKKLKGFKHLTSYKQSHNNNNCVSFVTDYLYWRTFALRDKKRMAFYPLLTIIYLS